MIPQLRKVQIEAPQSSLKGLMEELSRLGALLQGMANESSMHTIDIEIRADNVRALEVWLSTASNGTGRVISNKLVNDEDA